MCPLDREENSRTEDFTLQVRTTWLTVEIQYFLRLNRVSLLAPFLAQFQVMGGAPSKQEFRTAILDLVNSNQV